MNTLSFKTVSANKKTVTKNWIVVDANAEILGRLSSKIAMIIRGKNKPGFTPHVDCGDRVIVINADKVRLTGKKWTSDTITINPPATYNQLNANDQQSYRIAVGFFKNTFLIFNEDGTVSGGGDYDFGYNQWRLINNNRDIETLSANNRKDTLFNWTADNQRFTYQRRFNQSFDCTIIFK